MADSNPADKLASGIVRSATPAGMFEKMGGKFDPAPLLQMLQRLLGGQQPRTPRLDEPLPRFDPQTGRIIEPPGGAMGRPSTK